MAQQTTTLNFVQCTYVNRSEPNTAYTSPDPNYPHYYGLYYSQSEPETMLLVQFGQFPSNLSKKKLISATMTMRTLRTAYAVPLMGTFTRGTTTWNTKPDSYPRAYQDQLYIAGNGTSSQLDAQYAAYSAIPEEKVAEFTSLVLKYSSLALFNGGGTSAVYDLLNNGVSTPYLVITYDDAVSVTSQIKYVSGPQSGYNDPKTATSFSWDYERADAEIFCADDTFSQSSATFYWKDSTAGSYTSVAISGGTKSVTIAANTFPAGKTIQWYVSGTDTDGTTTQTEVYSFSTSAGTAYATAQSPINSVEDGSAPITFKWTLSSTDGQTPSGVDLWWKKPSEGDNQFHVILNNVSARTSHAVAANTFPAGEIQWIVRAYNVDGTAGPWSKPASGYYSFISIAAPNPVEGLSATAVPITTINWQSDAQQAYMISIDGVMVKKGFGSDVSSWTVEEPLEEGTHEISVSVQGIYGFWSQPSVISLTVGGATGAIQLTGQFDIDAELNTNQSSATARYYRDGICIGTAPADMPFTDRLALGTHDYFARVFTGDGNYKQSNTVTGTMQVESKMIASRDGVSSWLDLRLSENSMDTDEYRLQQEEITQHIKGAVWPHGERSSFRDMYASYNCAFVKEEDAKAFESLIGKVVVLKSKGDQVVIGMLSQVQKRVSVFYTSYSFSIQRTHDRDFTEITA